MLEIDVNHNDMNNKCNLSVKTLIMKTLNTITLFILFQTIDSNEVSDFKWSSVENYVFTELDFGTKNASQSQSYFSRQSKDTSVYFSC